MMKFICVYVVILLASISLCHADGFKIKGKISGGGEGVKVFLTDLSQYRHFYDSTTIKNGEFEFNGKVESPEMRCITIYKNDSQRGEWKSTVKLPIFVDNSSMTLEAPYDSLPTKSSKTVPGCIKITGSPANDLYMKYDKGLEPLSTLNSTLFEKYRVAYYYAKADELGRKNMQPAYDALEELENCKDEIYRYKVKFIQENSDSPVALYVAGTLAITKYGRGEINKVLALLSEPLRNSPKGKALEKRLNSIPVYVGDQYLDIDMLDKEGNTVNLSDVINPGQYTLLEIWASWCGPCRGGIPHLKDAYSAYHAKGFDIVSVSIDANKEQWKKALEQEQMAWLQVCDKGEGFDGFIVKKYGISGVPSSFLIDPQGKIILTNARGGWLDTKLIELFEK